MELKPRKIEFQTIEHFDPSGKSLGFLNELESLDLKHQIISNKIEGYYIIYKDAKYLIDPLKGDFIGQTKDIFYQYSDIFIKLIKAKQNNQPLILQKLGINGKEKT